MHQELLYLLCLHAFKKSILLVFPFRRVCSITLGSGLRVHCVLSSGDIPWLALTLEWHIWKSAFFGLFSRYFRSWFIRQSIRHSVTMWIWDVRFVKSYESFCFSVRLDMVSATSTKVLSFYPSILQTRHQTSSVCVWYTSKLQFLRLGSIPRLSC